MLNKLKKNMDNKRFRATTLGAVAFFFLLVGLMVASGLHWTSSSGAEGLGKTTQVSSAASAFPSSFADLAESLGPTVVNVKVTKVEKVRAFQSPQVPEGPFGEFFKRFFKEMPQLPENYKRHGAGSGVIISHDGYILTNNHVVQGAKEVTVTLSNKQEYEARIVGRDSKTDLAVLKIDAKGSLHGAKLGNSNQLKVGDWVLAIGNPFGLSHTVTSGIVSAKGRIIGAGPYDDFIQTDASINPGNSGGPLFNMRGEVVGINTAIIPFGHGIGFAIPINVAKPLIPQLVTTGKVTRGYLGVSIQPITPELAEALRLKEIKGALVGDVVQGSPAEKAGIHRGDVIVAFNKKAIKGAHDLASMVAGTPGGQDAIVTVFRDGGEHQLSVKVGKLQSEKAKVEDSSQPDRGTWGLLLQDLSPRMASRLGLTSDTGVVVAGVKHGSPADQAGIQQGDIILEVNRKPVKSAKEAGDLIAKASDKESLLILLKRDQGSFFVALVK